MTKQHHPEAMQQKLLQLFRTHEKELREDVTIKARLIDWISMHGYLQLALRHPEARSGKTGEFIDYLCGTIEQAALQAGVWDQEMVAYLRRDQSEAEAEARKLSKKRGIQEESKS